ncbi:MAG: helix-turn-helix domain-containing protein [Planctomycetota bacterium]
MNGASYHRPAGLLAGFAAHTPDAAIPEVRSVGEQWAPAAFEIGHHAHAVWECYLQVEGRSQWRCQGQEYDLQAGSWYLVRPHVDHALLQPPRSHHYFYLEVDIAACRQRLGPCAAAFDQTPPFCTGKATELQDGFRQLVHEVAVAKAWRSLGLRLALDRLLLDWARQLAQPLFQRLIDRHPAVDQACRLLEAQPEAAWSIALLARQVGISAGHLRHLFQQECGMNPHTYLITCRLDRARQLLRDTDQPITRIAQLCGFATSQHFARHVRRAQGCCAREWRQALRRSDGAASHAPDA